MVYLNRQPLTLSLPTKYSLRLESFSIIYSHLMINNHKINGMVNKDTPSCEHLIRIRVAPFMVELNFILWDLVISMNFISIFKKILIEIFLFHRILLYCLYFIGLEMTLYKIKVGTLGTFNIRHWNIISCVLILPVHIKHCLCWKPICPSIKFHLIISLCLGISLGKTFNYNTCMEFNTHKGSHQCHI